MGFKKYRRTNIAEMKPYEEGDDITDISISKADKDNGSPKKCDMIARNPKNHKDTWLVAKDYFDDNFELIEDELDESKSFIKGEYKLKEETYESDRNDLVGTVSKILKRDVTDEEACHFALNQFGLLTTYLREKTPYMKSDEKEIEEATYVVNKDDLDQMKDKFDDNDTVKVINEFEMMDKMGKNVECKVVGGVKYCLNDYWSRKDKWVNYQDKDFMPLLKYNNDESVTIVYLGVEDSKIYNLSDIGIENKLKKENYKITKSLLKEFINNK